MVRNILRGIMIVLTFATIINPIRFAMYQQTVDQNLDIIIANIRRWFT